MVTTEREQKCFFFFVFYGKVIGIIYYTPKAKEVIDLF